MKLNYVELNELNKKEMSREIRQLHYDWSDDTLLDRLCFSFETIDAFSDECETNKKIISEINRLIIKLKNNSISLSYFLRAVQKPCNLLNGSLSKYYYRDFEDYKRMIDAYSRIVIHAPGGMGKSRFIYDLEEKLASLNLKHLVLYGKYFSNISLIDFDEIIATAKHENFVFVFDSINEIQSDKNRELLLQKICEVKKVRNLSIILTYRDYSIDDSTASRLGDFRKCYFNGVRYESALQHLTQKFGKSTLQYEHILETNNPLYLNALSTIFDKKIIKNNKNIVRITGLLEQYVKTVFNSRGDGQKYWNLLKQIAKLMFDNRRKRVTKKEISSILKTINDKEILDELLQSGFLVKQGEICFFSMDTMADYLIIRYAFDAFDLNKRDSIKELEKIFNKLPELKEIGALYLIDKKGLNSYTLKLIQKHKLRFDYELMSRIVYSEEDVKYIRTRIKNIDLLKAFAYMGGLKSMPFNCVNKLSHSFLKNQSNYFNFCLSFQVPSDYSNLIARRLKNIVIALSNSGACSNEEYFYFAVWSLGISNEEIWILAKKTLLIIFENNDAMIKKGISLYKRIDNDFIRDGIVEAISCTSRQKGKITTRFLNSCLKDPHFLNAFNIGKIERHFERKISPCRYTKDNYYEIIDYNWMTKEKKEAFQKLYLYHDVLMCFEVSHSGFVTSTISFMDADKIHVNKVNKELSLKYKCFNGGECCGYHPAEDYLQKKYGKLKEVPSIALAAITSYFLEYLLRKYNISLEELVKGFQYRFASCSMLHKFLKIAESYMLGSLMCNYYTNEFSSFNGYDNPIIGYQPFDPLMYETDYYSLNCLVPLFNKDIDNLNNIIVKKIVDDDVHDKKWSDDINAVVLKIEDLFKPIVYKKEEWIPICLVCEIVDNKSQSSPREYISFRIEYNTNYHIKRFKEHRYNTIEFKTYNGNVNDYSFSHIEKGICYEINKFSRNYIGLIDRSVILPPPAIINELSLAINKSNDSYLNGDKRVIIFDKSPISYYDSLIKHSIYIKREYFKKLSRKIRFFGYTERYNYKEGYSRKASIYFEKELNKPIKYFKNYEQKKKYKSSLPKKCIDCKNRVGIITKKAREDAMNTRILINMFDDDNTYK